MVLLVAEISISNCKSIIYLFFKCTILSIKLALQFFDYLRLKFSNVMIQRFKVLIFSHIPKFRYFIDLLYANVLLLIMLQHVYIEGYHGSKITKSRNLSSCHWNVNGLAAHNIQKCLKLRHRIPFTIMILYVYQKRISIPQYNYR